MLVLCWKDQLFEGIGFYWLGAWTGNQTGGGSLARESHLSSGTTSPPPLAAAAAKNHVFLLYD